MFWKMCIRDRNVRIPDTIRQPRIGTANKGPELISNDLSIVRMDPIMSDMQKNPNMSIVPPKSFTALIVFSGIT